MEDGEGEKVERAVAFGAARRAALDARWAEELKAAQAAAPTPAETTGAPADPAPAAKRRAKD